MELFTTPVKSIARPQKYKLPNVRKLFLPDPGNIIFDVDLTGADAAVAAKECGGQYWAAIASGRKINVEILEYCYPEVYRRWKDMPPDPPGQEGKKDASREPAYTKCKNMHYGSIYVGKPKGISSSAAIPLPIIQRMQPWFFTKFPEVPGWHTRVNEELYRTRGVHNAFGYKVTYFDRLEGLLPEAVNWVCQSTVGVVCQRGSLIVRREFRQVKLRLQVHDSLVGQLPIRTAERDLLQIRERLNSIEVPYDSPLRIPWGMKVSDKSWGHCVDFNDFFGGRKAA